MWLCVGLLLLSKDFKKVFAPLPKKRGAFILKYKTMNNFFNTDYRTFLIGFVNSSTTVIIQHEGELEEVIKWATKNGLYMDIDNVKNLNAYKRFVKVKQTPSWLAEGLYKDVMRRKDDLVKRVNDM